MQPPKALPDLAPGYLPDTISQYPSTHRLSSISLTHLPSLVCLENFHPSRKTLLTNTEGFLSSLCP